MQLPKQTETARVVWMAISSSKQPFGHIEVGGLAQELQTMSPFILDSKDHLICSGGWVFLCQRNVFPC